MTSLLNIDETRRAFEATQFYGLAKSDVMFFAHYLHSHRKASYSCRVVRSLHLVNQVRCSSSKLLYGAGNLCNHLLRSDFLALAATATPEVLPFHVAKKTIPFADEADSRGSQKQPEIGAASNAVKLEVFIFDAFTLASSQAALTVNRTEEFAPVKNHAAKSDIDTPTTARSALLCRGAAWARW